MKVLGREPAAVIAFIGAVLTALAAVKLPWLNAGQAAALTAAFAGILIAVTTRPVAPALFTAAFVAVAALFGEYGLGLSDEVIGGVTAVILAGFALAGVRPQVTPVIDPRPVN
jgi:AcrR family transcriptional regulator